MLLSRAAGTSLGAHIRLEKHIPHGAGLGGGSSDAATTLLLLQRLWRIDPESVDLPGIALDLGSDVPFFIGPPVARGEGRGERLKPLAMPESVGRSIFVVAVPPVSLSTASSYGLVTAREAGRPDIEAIFTSEPVSMWQHLENDFQDVIRPKEEAVDAALNALESGGATFSSLSGSGAGVFGLFSDMKRAELAREALVELSCRTWIGRPGDPPDSPTAPLS